MRPRVYVIGCGGIGGHLLDKLPQMLASLSLDQLATSEQSYVMGNEGTISIPCIVDSLTLIDADVFTGHNALRQADGVGSKLDVQMQKIQGSVLYTTWLRNMRLIGFNNYIKPENIASIIPPTVEDNIVNKSAYINYNRTYDGKSVPIVFLCVDNHKTRYQVCRYVEAVFSDCIIINGGNEKTTGNITFYEKKDGRALCPSLLSLYPEINPSHDLRPDETPCTGVAPQNDQVTITNDWISIVMAEMLTKWLTTGAVTRPYKGRPQAFNEVLLDVESLSMVVLNHQVKESK